MQRTQLAQVQPALIYPQPAQPQGTEGRASHHESPNEIVRDARNPFSLAQTLDKLRYYLSATKRGDALELLEKAVNKARVDKHYAGRMTDALLYGSTIEYRELLSDFGNYFEKPKADFPFYPHHDAVNAIDTALFHIKIGYEQQAIDDFNSMHN